MVNNKAKMLAKYAIMFAVIFVAMMVDKVISIIPVGFSMAVCVLLVTLSFCFLDNSWKNGIISGLFFGIASFIKEFIMPSAVLGQVFPPIYWLLVTIPPRVAMSTLAFCTYRLMLLATRKMTNAKTRQILSMAVATFVGLAVNTLAFVSSLELSRYIYTCIHGASQTIQNKGVFVMIYALLFTNIIPEYLISILCVAPIVLGVRKGLGLGLDGNNEKNANTTQNSNAFVQNIVVDVQNTADGNKVSVATSDKTESKNK